MAIQRRTFLADVGLGFTGLALAAMLHRDGVAAGDAWSPPNGRPHFAPKAKSVIWLFMNGGVSHMESFDPKPELLKRQGEAMADVGPVVTIMGNPGGLMPSPFRFRKHGECGMEISELFPYMAKHADDFVLVRSCHGDAFDHAPAMYLYSTGSQFPGRPSLGSWAVYGLGTINPGLPCFSSSRINRRCIPWPSSSNAKHGLRSFSQRFTSTMEKFTTQPSSITPYICNPRATIKCFPKLGRNPRSRRSCL